MGETKMANEIWETIFKNRGKVSTKESDREPDICGICGNDKSQAQRDEEGKTICEAAEENCPESKII